MNCGRRWGKSTMGEELACEPALRGYPVGWFSPDYKSLLEVWRDLCRILRPVIRRKSEQEKRLELITGGVIEFWALDADPECSRGRKYRRVIVDEAAKVRHLMRAWLEAIRANLADYEGDAWFLSTPKGRNDYWELYQRGNPESGSYDPLWASFKMPTGANPYILPGEIEAMRREMGPQIASQEIDAEFMEVGGRFFSDWEERRHVRYRADVDPKAHWTYFGGFDWGYGAPFCFLLACTDEAGNVLIVDEVYKPRTLNGDQAQLVLDTLDRWGLKPKDVTIYADPSMWAKKVREDGIGRADVEDFWKLSLQFVRANNNRQHGWTQFRQFLAAEGAFTVLRGHCPNLIRTIPLMVHDEKHVEDLDTELEDHAVDACRYLLNSRPKPSGPDPALPPAPKPYQPRWMRKTDKKVPL